MDYFIFGILVYTGLTFIANLLYFRKRKRKTPEFFEKISILIPVRNEEENIGRCLNSLLAQDYPDYEIIVMDDESEDRSYEILQEYQKKYPEKVKIAKSRPLPSGWTGKNWVCYQLSQMASGKWLLFADADTIHGRSCISNAYIEAISRKADLVSYLPDLITVSLAEKIVLPVIYFAFYLLFPFPLMKIIKDHRAAAAIGTFILIKRDMYEKIGGHRAIKEEIVEDVYLARLVKKYGGNFDLLDGCGIFYTRFYRNLKEIWEGFTKNSFGAFGYNLIPYFFFLLIAYTAFLHPFLRLVIEPSFTLHNSAFLQAFVILIMRLFVALRTGHSLLSVIFHPFMILFSLLFALNSAWKIVRKQPVTWKERAYRVFKD